MVRDTLHKLPLPSRTQLPERFALNNTLLRSKPRCFCCARENHFPTLHCTHPKRVTPCRERLTSFTPRRTSARQLIPLFRCDAPNKKLRHAAVHCIQYTTIPYSKAIDKSGGTARKGIELANSLPSGRRRGLPQNGAYPSSNKRRMGKRRVSNRCPPETDKHLRGEYRYVTTTQW